LIYRKKTNSTVSIKGSRKGLRQEPIPLHAKQTPNSLLNYDRTHPGPASSKNNPVTIIIIIIIRRRKLRQARFAEMN